jgi:energy-coupling factor transporter transmembrane protein EcfT
LFQIPIRVIGGPYTLEALAFGAAAGIQIATMLLIMIFFSQVVAPQDILRRTPIGFYPLGVTASIGFSFAPRIRQALSELQEAHQIRGYSSQGWRDIPKLMTPLVIISLENSIAIAESLVSRGWSRVEYTRWVVLPGWIAIAIGFGSIAIGVFSPLFVIAALVFGCGALWFGYRGKNKISRYRPEAWSFPDSVVVAVALGILGAFLILAGFVPALLAFYPFPIFIWPTFSWPVAAAIALFATPLLVERD